MNYDRKIDRIISDCDDIIIDTLGSYDTSDLEEIVVGLVCNHAFTSHDSIRNLIYTLEKLEDAYKGSNIERNDK
jgi:hypothetical protein